VTLFDSENMESSSPVAKGSDGRRTSGFESWKTPESRRHTLQLADRVEDDRRGTTPRGGNATNARRPRHRFSGSDGRKDRPETPRKRYPSVAPERSGRTDTPTGAERALRFGVESTGDTASCGRHEASPSGPRFREARDVPHPGGNTGHVERRAFDLVRREGVWQRAGPSEGRATA
jgi:hypothetical protein